MNENLGPLGPDSLLSEPAAGAVGALFLAARPNTMAGQFLFVHVNLLAPLASPDTIPISEATILAHLKKHGFSGRILGDFADDPLKPQVLAEAIRRHRPLAIGFTTYQENIEQIRLWARLAKKISPDVRIVLGGPQVTFMPAEALSHMPEVDFLCRDEGESVMLGLARALSRGQDPARVPGLCFLQDGKVTETGPSHGEKDLDAYASPYLTDLIDLKQKDRAVMLTSRGCPYRCAFCYTPQASRRQVRFYSIERIIEEMAYLKSKGIRAFWFADPNFSFSRNRLVTLLEAIIRDVPNVTFWCQTRYDLVDQELLSLLKRAGADNLAYGLESANPEVLKKIDKRIDLNRLSRVIRLTQAAGIHVELFSMFALPGESFDQALNTLKFVKAHDIAIDGNSISQQAHLFFGTPMNDAASAFGIRPFPRTRPAYLSVCRDYETEAMPADEIRRISLIWRLNRDDFAEDVHHGRNLFHRAAFIVQNRDALADQPEAGCFLVRIYLHLEEFDAARGCLAELRESFPHEPAVKKLLNGPFQLFKTGRGRGKPGSRFIFDCQGSVNGKPVPAACARFQEAVIGSGLLLHDFEKPLCEMAPGEYGHFDVAFPDAYGNPDLAGKVVTFRVHVHSVLEPLTIDRIEDQEEEALQNNYALTDIEALRQHNANLCYKVLNGYMRRAEPMDMANALMLTNFYLKLGFIDRATAVAEKLCGSPVYFVHAAHLFRMNGQPRRALAFLDRIRQNEPVERLVRAQALFDLERFDEAEKVAGSLTMRDNIPFAELRVGLAGRLSLPLEVYLEREEGLLDARTRSLLQTR